MSDYECNNKDSVEYFKKFVISLGVNTALLLIGFYYRSTSMDFTVLVTDAGNWTKFILSMLTARIGRNSLYLGLFGLVITLNRKNMIKFHSLFTLFNSVVLVTLIVSFILIQL